MPRTNGTVVAPLRTTSVAIMVRGGVAEEMHLSKHYSSGLHLHNDLQIIPGQPGNQNRERHKMIDHCAVPRCQCFWNMPICGRGGRHSLAKVHPVMQSASSHLRRMIYHTWGQLLMYVRFNYHGSHDEIAVLRSWQEIPHFPRRSGVVSQRPTGARRTLMHSASEVAPSAACCTRMEGFPQLAMSVKDLYSLYICCVINTSFWGI